MFFILFSLVCLRGNGFGLADYENYRRFYDLVLTWDDVVTTSVPAEIGFRFFSYIGNFLGFNSQFIIVVMGVLSTFPVYYLIRKYSQYKTLSIFFWLPYFLTFNMHTSRTAVAAAFGVLFIHAFLNKKYIKSLAWFLAAFSFHKASFVLLLVFLTLFNAVMLYYMVFAAFLIMFVVKPIDLSVFLLNKVGMDALSNKILAYRGGYFGYSIPLYDPRILVSLIISFWSFRIRNCFSRFEIYCFKIFLIGTLLLIGFSEVVIMAWRSSYYFLLNGVIFIPVLARYYNLRVFKGSKIKMALTLFLILSYGLYLFWLILHGQPYTFYF